MGKTATRIAILGWGSLIWRPRELATEGVWQPDGPLLPIEFPRISGEDRLTLVLREGAELVQTYWIISGKSTLEEAREDLRNRKGCQLDSIGLLTRKRSKHFASFPGLQETVEGWLRTKNSLDAVIWTDLRSNFHNKTGNEFSTTRAVTWLEDLINNEKQKAAEEYVRKASSQTDTALRRLVGEKFGWTDIPNPGKSQGMSSEFKEGGSNMISVERAKARTFRGHIVWRKALEFVLKIYKYAAGFPKQEIYGLSIQMRRAGVSVAGKIAEGFRKRGRADKVRFMNTAEGSIEESRYYLKLTEDLGYRKTEELTPLLEQVSRLLNAYSRAIVAADS